VGERVPSPTDQTAAVQADRIPTRENRRTIRSAKGSQPVAPWSHRPTYMGTVCSGIGGSPHRRTVVPYIHGPTPQRYRGKRLASNRERGTRDQNRRGAKDCQGTRERESPLTRTPTLPTPEG